MLKCRHSRALVAALAFALACVRAGRPALVGPAREQPSTLVGRWARDVRDDARSETLVLRADGVEWTEAADGHRVGSRAWWWVERAEGDSARLCLHWRAGRHGADCAAFELDSVRAITGAFVVRMRWAGQSYIAARAR